VESSCHALVKLDTSGGGGCSIVLDSANVYTATNEIRIVPKTAMEATSFGAWVTQPSGLAVDDAYIYFNAGNGGVARAVKGGKSGFTPFAGEGQGSPKHMAWQGGVLYWNQGATNTNPPSIYEAPTTGTMIDPTMPPAVFSPDGYGIGTLAVDATSVYYWGASGLVKEDKATQQVTPLAAGQAGVPDDHSAIVVDGSTVYFSTAPAPGVGGLVSKVSVAGGQSTIVVGSEVGATGVFTADATDVYFMTNAAVMKAPKSGGAPVLVSPLDPPSPFATCMAADDTYVYWIDGISLMQYKK
jgi:hypothetical protein